MSEQGGSTRINDAETGSLAVRADQPTHLLNGKFAPGNGLGGRKPKALERAYLDAVRNAVPPEEIEILLGEALTAARNTRSWRGIVEVVNLVMAYGAGKPTQRVVQTDGNLERLLDALRVDAPLLPEASSTLNTGDERK